MSFRFFTRKKLFPGVTLNMSKSGPSLSIGPRGLKHTIGGRGSRTTLGLPGTGLNYTVRHGKGRKARAGQSQAPAQAPQPTYRVDTAAASATLDRDFLRAVVAFQGGNTGEALAKLDEMPGIADASWLAGVIELRDGNWISAADHLEAALKNQDDLGQICARNGVSIEIAYPITPEVTAHIGPDSRSARLALAEAYQAGQQLSEALRVLKSMIHQVPEDLVVALSLAEVAFEANDGRKMKMSDLVAILDRAAPVSGLGWARDVMRARALARGGALTEAIDSYARAMLDDDTPEDVHKLAWYERALLFEETGDRTRCRQELSGLYAHDKSFADVADRLRKRA
ncbi:DUF4236 domain-containing protein [Puniceibacterium sp. IMCC21224]|uniref:DUF4236 domain-containing protein n=1 Tax=Puniceibacterium sp. IMCC21224 TaxID=1618204 RepID=UPI00065CEE8E|nr:DUF4236 domain-containing protein [Puniceibacterium sp. IMCC21224]KMK68663.1 Protein of unknown function (DUF4236) [Puniceibacterium sp. IMCC21224]